MLLDRISHETDDSGNILHPYIHTVNSVNENTGRVTPVNTEYTFKTDSNVPSLGLMMVGWGGNNGTTVTAGIMANRKKLSWETKEGFVRSNFYGSVTQASTCRVGETTSGEEVFVPMSQILPTSDPVEWKIGGWDISAMSMGKAMKRAKVLDVDLQRQLFEEMEDMTPLPSPYYPDFIAGNQADRADNVMSGTKYEQLGKLRADIRSFKKDNSVDKVIVLWTANTERFCDVSDGLNVTSVDLLESIRSNKDEISPSQLFAVAAILEGCPFINGSPQNSLVPGIIALAEENGVSIAGDDFKSGQTKLKSVLVDFLVTAGIKPTSIVSYNHLGNNDGKNLSEYKQFRSKEISKSNVVDDMVASNEILYPEGEYPDHTVVIKYVPSVGDSKRAMDEYRSEIFMGGCNTISIHNTCEDSLLAAPLIIDLVVLCEIFDRIKWSTDGIEFRGFRSVLSALSYCLKAPVVPAGAPVVNSLFTQRNCIEKILKAAAGISEESETRFHHR